MSLSRDTKAVVVFAAILGGLVILASGELEGMCFLACVAIVLSSWFARK